MGQRFMIGVDLLFKPMCRGALMLSVCLLHSFWSAGANAKVYYLDTLGETYEVQSGELKYISDYKKNLDSFDPVKTKLPEFPSSPDLKTNNSEIKMVYKRKVQNVSPFQQVKRMFFFSHDDEKQAVIAKKLSQKYGPTMKLFSIDFKGWEDYGRLKKGFGTMVYPISEPMKKSFGITSVPFFIYIEKGYMYGYEGL